MSGRVTVSANNGTAEILGFEDAKARLRAPDLDPNNFLAVGSYLEAVREQKGLTLRGLAETTHIKASYLEAIETMALEGLPSRAFATGFVRTYAEALGLEPGPLVERFKSEAGFAEANAHKKAEAAPEEAPAPPEPEARDLSLIAVAVVVAFIIWCGYLITRPDPERRVPVRVDAVPSIPSPAGQAEMTVEAAEPAPTAIPNTAQTPPDVEAALPEPAPQPALIEARVIERVDPIYPPTCETGAAPIEVVVIGFTVTPQGNVVSERVTRSRNACFESAALNAVRRWKFEPRTIDGVPSPAYEQRVTLEFKRPS